MRLVESLGGNPEVMFRTFVLFDTGSDVQTVFEDDLKALKYDKSTYKGAGRKVVLSTANGYIT